MVDYQGNLIDAEGIKNLPETTYALFRKGTIPNFAGPMVQREGLAEAIEKCLLPKNQIEIMEFRMNLEDGVVAKALNMKHSAEVPNMRI